MTYLKLTRNLHVFQIEVNAMQTEKTNLAFQLHYFENYESVYENFAFTLAHAHHMYLLYRQRNITSS